MSDLRTPEVEDLLHVFAALDDEDTIFALLEDLFTIREIKDTSQRLAVARQLDAGKSYGHRRSYRCVGHDHRARVEVLERVRQATVPLLLRLAIPRSAGRVLRGRLCGPRVAACKLSSARSALLLARQRCVNSAVELLSTRGGRRAWREIAGLRFWTRAFDNR